MKASFSKKTPGADPQDASEEQKELFVEKRNINLSESNDNDDLSKYK